MSAAVTAVPDPAGHWRLGKLRPRHAVSILAESSIDPGTVTGQAYERSKYRAGQVSSLISRYVRIRGDLILAHASLDPGDQKGQGAAEVCKGFLVDAKAELERRSPSLIAVSNLLGLADRMLVLLYRTEILRIRLKTYESELRDLTPVPTAQIALLRNAALELDDPNASQRETAETVLKDAITHLTQRSQQSLIEDDLQVSRLSRVLAYLIGAWLLLVAAIPFVSRVQAIDDEVLWPIYSLGRGDLIDLLAGAIGLSVVGAAGGVVSGMLKVRDSHATVLEYRTSMKRLALKPMVGAIAALVVYLFLTAGMISGIDITSAGTFVVLAFVAGFSERYFLAILNTPSESRTSPPPDPALAAAAPGPAGTPGPARPAEERVAAPVNPVP